MSIATSPALVAGRSLAGRGIVVTRPLGQAEGLAALVKAALGRPIVFPAIEIVEPTDATALRTLIARLDQFDDAIFISPTAVIRALDQIRARRELPARLRIAAIGTGSVRELVRRGVAQVIVPAGRFDSEALLALPEFCDVAGRAIVIFRGEGGRELLGDTLTERGATIEYAACYRRARPDSDAQGLLNAWAHDEIHAVTVTSAEALCNLDAMVGTSGRHWLRETPLFVPHQRIATAARELGIERIVVTGPGDEGLVEGMIGYFANATQDFGSVTR